MIDSDEIRSRLEKAMGDRLALYRFRNLSIPDLELALAGLGHPVVTRALRASRAQAARLPGTECHVTGEKVFLLSSICGLSEYMVLHERCRSYGTPPPTGACLASDLVVADVYECRDCRRLVDVVNPGPRRISIAVNAVNGRCWHASLELRLSCAS